MVLKSVGYVCWRQMFNIPQVYLIFLNFQYCHETSIIKNLQRKVKNISFDNYQTLKKNHFTIEIAWLVPVFGPASMAQLAERPTGDQEVVGLTPVGSATFFLGDSEQQIILGAFGYLTLSKFSQLGKVTLLFFSLSNDTPKNEK